MEDYYHINTNGYRDYLKALFGLGTVLSDDVKEKGGG